MVLHCLRIGYLNFYLSQMKKMFYINNSAIYPTKIIYFYHLFFILPLPPLFCCLLFRFNLLLCDKQKTFKKIKFLYIFTLKNLNYLWQI